ncbi:MAG: PhnD/SsuA/transferrin family substrate-binding protein [Pseudomonadota bacterium]
MLRRLLIIGLIALPVLTVFCFSNDYAHAESGHVTQSTQKRYELAISPCGMTSMMFKKFRPLATYLSESTGLKIDLFIPQNFNEFIKKVKDSQSTLFYMDPGIYLGVHDVLRKDYIYAFLGGFIDKCKGKPLETGCIITRKDGNIKTVKDLKGKSVIFGPPASATKSLASRKYFIDNGINIKKDLAQDLTGGSCMDIVLDVFHRKADAGCIRTIMCPICNPSIYYKNHGPDVTKLSHVAKTSSVMTWIFTCTHGTDPEDMDKVVNALVKIPKLDAQKRQELPKEIWEGFVKLEDGNFEELRKLAEQ